jgi:hypothetical protein
MKGSGFTATACVADVLAVAVLFKYGAVRANLQTSDE